MKIFYKILPLLFVLNFIGHNLFATHAAGGELIYEHIPGTTNQYKFTLKFYRDCGSAGIFTSTEPATFQLCYTSPCTGTISTVTMPKIIGNLPTTPAVPNGSPLDNGCNGITTCDDINSSVHGYRQWWYSAIVTLPTTCNAWTFWTTLCCRNDITGNITNPPGSQYFYVECTFDNTVSQNNSSAAFVNSNTGTSLPVPYVCINLPYTHTAGAIDPDGDSLVFETIQPRHKTGCNTAAPVNLLLPAYNISNTAGEPFPTSNTYNLNTTNGFFNFTPNTLGYYVLCIKASEYRNGVLIGTAMRDMQVVVDVCQPLPITSLLDSISIVNGNIILDTVVTCPASNLQFCFDITDQLNPFALVSHISDDHATVMPGSTVTITNPSLNTLHVCVNWQSSMADANTNKTFTVYVKDSLGCVSAPAAVSVDLKIKKLIFAGGDTTMCSGDTTTALWATGNGLVQWNALPGGDDNTSLSCTVCPNPIAWPRKTTQYEVTDLECGYKDTATVSILALPDPIANFTLTPKNTTLADPNFTMINTSTNAISYKWFDQNHNFLGNSTDMYYTGTETGNYCFTLEATNFCYITKVKTDCATILPDGSVSYPNAFTPNGDGLNDIFRPIIKGDMSIYNYSFSIYNRWGIEIFRAKNIKDGWNGSYKGNPCPTDTYYYFAETFDASNKKHLLKGDLILIR